MRLQGNTEGGKKDDPSTVYNFEDNEVEILARQFKKNFFFSFVFYKWDK
jgi:hypothetical protein